MVNIERIRNKLASNWTYEASSSRRCKQIAAQLNQTSETIVHVWLPREGNSQAALINSILSGSTDKFFGHVSIDIPANYLIHESKPRIINLYPEPVYMSFTHGLSKSELFSGSKYSSYEEECRGRGQEAFESINIVGLNAYYMHRQADLRRVYHDLEGAEETKYSDILRIMENPLGALITFITGRDSNRYNLELMNCSSISSQILLCGMRAYKDFNGHFPVEGYDEIMSLWSEGKDEFLQAIDDEEIYLPFKDLVPHVRTDLPMFDIDETYWPQPIETYFYAKILQFCLAQSSVRKEMISLMYAYE
ncbi:MAG: hypothetical protein AAGA18_13935 [Verrucomicrobiota bacterium]